MRAKLIVAAILMGAVAITASCKRVEAEGSNNPAFTAINGEYLKTGGDGSNWAMAGFNYNEQRFSPLKSINDTNVAKLGLAWFADLPDARGQEATPVVIDGKMFITTAWSKVFAYDAKTGKPLWNYDPKVDQARGVKACCDVVNRGVAFWKGQLFVGTIDGRLVSLDAATGKELWSQQTLDKAGNGTITGVPRVIKDKVVIGFGGAEFGVRGYVTAYDAATGKQAWRFFTVPNPDGKADGAASDDILATASKSWSAVKKLGDWHESGGGGTVWDAIVYDAELDQLYLGVGNGNPWNHGIRSNGEGDNLFLSSVVAINPDSGKYIWHYQETPGETWDYTATQPIVLANETRDGKVAKVLYHAPKNGFFFTIDRTNGKLLGAEPFVKGLNWASGYDMKTGRPIENPDARFYKSGKMFLANPSALGAHNWMPMSYNPATGLVYIPAQQIGGAYLPQMAPNEQTRKPLGFNTGTAMAAADLPDDINIVKAVQAATVGQLVAFDPRTGKAKWTVDHQSPWNGGTMTTAGNLVFQGNGMGQFNAYAADNGKLLFSMPVQSGVLGGAATYSVDGEQYIAFMTSKGGAFPLVSGYAGGASRQVPNIPRLVVLKLGGKGAFPALPKEAAYVWNPPVQVGTPTDIAAGASHYQRNCLVCHNPGAVGGGVLPDLRKAASVADAADFKSVVIDGVLKSRGMVSFASVLSPAEAEQVRAYIISRAHYAKANDAVLTVAVKGK